MPTWLIFAGLVTYNYMLTSDFSDEQNLEKTIMFVRMFFNRLNLRRNNFAVHWPGAFICTYVVQIINTNAFYYQISYIVQAH